MMLKIVAGFVALTLVAFGLTMSTAPVAQAWVIPSAGSVAMAS